MNSRLSQSPSSFARSKELSTCVYTGHRTRCALPPPTLPFALLAAWPLEADPSHRDGANDRDWSEPAAMTLEGPLFLGMSFSFFCMTDSTSGVRDEEPMKRAPPPLSSSPFPTGLLHRAWVGLWNGVFAHDLPLSFLSGVRLGAPQPRKYIRKSLLSAHVSRALGRNSSCLRWIGMTSEGDKCVCYEPYDSQLNVSSLLKIKYRRADVHPDARPQERRPRSRLGGSPEPP